MPFTSLGEATLGNVVPIALSATAAATASLNLQLPEINAKLAALLQLQARVAITPPSIAGSIDVLVGLVANLNLALSLGLPSISVDLSAVAAVIAQLSASLGSLNAQLGLVLGIEATLGGASVHLLRYEGTVDGLAPSGIPGLSGSQEVNAIVVVGASSASWAAMQQVFKTS